MIKFLPSLFLLALLLLRIPPVYVIPLIKSSLLTSHSLARVVVLGLFGWMIWRRDYLKITSSQRFLFVLYLGYLFTHSISIVNVINFESFLLRYKDVVFPGMFLLTSFVYFKSRRNLIQMLVLSLIVNFGYQAIAYYWPSLYSFIGNILLYEGHREFVSFNLARGRIFIETYDEIVFPFLFMAGGFSIVGWPRLQKLLPFLIIVPTLLSNFRSRLLMLVVSIGLTFTAWFRSWKVVMKMGVVAIILIVVADSISLRLWGFSTCG